MIIHRFRALVVIILSFSFYFIIILHMDLSSVIALNGYGSPTYNGWIESPHGAVRSTRNVGFGKVSFGKVITS